MEHCGPDRPPHVRAPGRPAAQISGDGWPRSAWIHPRWCGITNGTLIRDLHSWEEGRRAVEEHIAGYLDQVNE